jgi:cytochrome P450
VSAYAQHHRADVYEDPDRFEPDRFLPEKEAARPKSSYLPFSAGPRFCIGVHFAMMEGPIVLATLLRRWRLEVDPSRTILEDDFATLRPKGGVPAIVHARSGP